MKNAWYSVANILIACGFLAYIWLPSKKDKLIPVPVAAVPVAADPAPIVIPPPEPPARFLPMSFDGLRHDSSFYVFEAKKTDTGVRPWNGRTSWTWKDDSRKTTVRFDGIDEKQLTRCVVSVAGADPNQPSVDMVFAASFIGRMFSDKKLERSVLKFWYTDPLLPVTAKINGCEFAFSVDNGVSSITATPE